MGNFSIITPKSVLKDIKMPNDYDLYYPMLKFNFSKISVLQSFLCGFHRLSQYINPLFSPPQAGRTAQTLIL